MARLQVRSLSAMHAAWLGPVQRQKTVLMLATAGMPCVSLATAELACAETRPALMPGCGHLCTRVQSRKAKKPAATQTILAARSCASAQPPPDPRTWASSCSRAAMLAMALKTRLTQSAQRCACCCPVRPLHRLQNLGTEGSAGMAACCLRMAQLWACLLVSVLAHARCDKGMSICMALAAAGMSSPKEPFSSLRMQTCIMQTQPQHCLLCSRQTASPRL